MQSLTRIASIALAGLLAACAAVKPLGTPTGRPEVTIGSTNASDIKGRIIAANAMYGYTLIQESPYLLVFSKPFEGWGGALYQASMGNAYSSQPQLVARYTIATMGSSTRVFASVETTMQNAFGRSDGMDLSKGKAGHEIQAVLQQIKAATETTPKRTRH